MSEPDFRIWVILPSKPGGSAQVIVRTPEGQMPLAVLVYAAQYMMHLAAQGGAKGGEGYEKTLDSLMQGAMTWKHLGVVEETKEGSDSH